MDDGVALARPEAALSNIEDDDLADPFVLDPEEGGDGLERSQEPAIGNQVKAKIKGGMSVFDRMMAGVKSARQANRASQPLRRVPVLSRPDRTRQARPAQKPEHQQPPREVAQPREKLFPISEDEEQLEIPAFLRRQAN